MTQPIASVGDNSQQPGMTSFAYYPDNLIAGDAKLVTDSGTLLTGKLARGAMLGQVTASGGYLLSVRTANDGSQSPSAVLVDDADATAGPVTIGVYLTGEFAATSVTMDPSWSPAQMKAAARTQNIFLKSSVTAADPL